MVRGDKVVIKLDVKDPEPDPEQETWTALVQQALMQYTGLKDKNGKEIYEGDVLSPTRKLRNPRGLLAKVVWEQATPYAGYRLIDNKGDGEYCLLQNNEELWEVIGNVYENPELLDNK